MIFIAACRLSLVAVSGGTLRCGAWASHCCGFSCCGVQSLSTWTSVAVARGLSSCASQALECRLSSCGARALLLHGMWDLPGPGLEPVSPALASGFLTTAPPGKSWVNGVNGDTGWAKTEHWPLETVVDCKCGLNTCHRQDALVGSKEDKTPACLQGSSCVGGKSMRERDGRRQADGRSRGEGMAKDEVRTRSWEEGAWAPILALPMLWATPTSHFPSFNLFFPYKLWSRSGPFWLRPSTSEVSSSWGVARTSSRESEYVWTTRLSLTFPPRKETFQGLRREQWREH